MDVAGRLHQLIRHDVTLHRFRGRDAYNPTSLVEIQALLRHKHHTDVPVREIRAMLASMNDPYLAERDYGPKTLDFLEGDDQGLLFPQDPETVAERARMTDEFHRIGYRGIGNTFVSTPVRLPYLRNGDQDRLGCICETRQDPTLCRMSDQCHWSDEYKLCGTKDEDGDVMYFH